MNQSQPLMAITDLKVHFPVTKGLLRRTIGHVKAVDGVSFDILQGETLGLVGESGCGKTTLGRALLKLVPVTDGHVMYRTNSLSGDKAEPRSVDIVELNEKDMKKIRRDIAAIFQDPFSSLNPRMTIADIIGEPLRVHGYPKDGRRDRIADLLKTVGLNPSAMKRYPVEFSGGQRQRIGIARAVALQPSFIMCDEPSSALDVSVQAQVLNLMADLQEKFQLTYLLISHNLAVVEYLGHRIAVMYLGRIVELSEPKALYIQPLHPYTEALLSSIPFPDPEARRKKEPLPGGVPSPINPPPGCHFHPRCKYAQQICQQETPVLQEAGDGRLVACHRWQEIELTGFSFMRNPLSNT